MTQLTEDIRTALSGFIRSNCYNDVSSTRQAALRRLIRNNYFWQGHHYIFPQRSENGTGINWQPLTNGSISGVMPDSGRRAYNNSLNFYKGDGKKLMGVLGRTPNAICSAIDQRNDSHVGQAESGNKILGELRRHWDVEFLNSYLVFCMWTCGTVYGYTPYGPDARRYGTTRIPRYRIESVQQPNGEFWDLPIEDGYDEFANGSVSLILATDYEVIKPTRIKSLEQAPWLIYEREVHKAKIASTYPEARAEWNKIGNSGVPYDNFGKTARDQAASNTTSARPESRLYFTESLVWLTPEMYDLMEVENTQSKQYFAKLRAAHPNGVKVVLINGYPIRMESENLHEVWFECPCEVGHSLDEPALGDETARINRAIDDTFNMAQEVAEKGAPINLYDSQVIDPNALAMHASNPVDWLPVLTGVGNDIRKAVHSTEPIELPQSVINLFEVAKTSMRENSGITPALSGSETKQQTLGEAEINRNMALLPHNVTWNFMRRFWAGVYNNGIRQIAKYNYAKAYFGGNRNTAVREIDIADMRSLLDGNWYVECEEAIPMTWGQIRAQAFQILGMGPEIMGMLGYTDPRNVKALLKSVGNTDLVLPGESQRTKTLADIGNLLRSAPIEQMGPMGPMPMASMPADEFEDNHEMVVQIVREWAISDVGRMAKIESPDGYMNVILWAKEHAAMAAPPPMPMEGGGAPPSSEPPPSQTDIGSMPPSGLDPNSELVPEEMAGLSLEGV